MALLNAERALIERFLEVEPDPVEWIEKNIYLPKTSAYAKPGRVVLDPFQKFIIRFALGHTSSKKIIKYLKICSSVQVGKSFLAEMIMCYLIRFRSAKIMLTYSIEKMCKRVFKERLQPLITGNPELNKFVTGKADDMCQEFISLTNGTIRLGSAEAPNTIASFSMPFIISSECSKYPDNVVDVKQLLYGRKNYYEKTGDYLVIMESSPRDKNDAFGRMMKESQIHLYPFVKAPCGHRIFMEDKIIRGICDEKGKTVQDPERIKSDVNNAWLECPVCGMKIYEVDHIKLLKGSVVWAPSADVIESDDQPSFEVEDATVHMNKLLNEGYKFVDCLSDYFSAKNKLDGGVALRTYQNETMGRATSLTDDQATDERKFVPMSLPYTIYTSNNRFPLPIKFAMFGADTQDRCFYYVIRGFTGIDTDTYLLDADTIEYDLMKQSKDDIYKYFRQKTFDKILLREDDYRIPLIGGCIDHGGHRAELVNYITARIPRLHRYKGSSKKDAPLLERGDSGIYFGNTEALSLQVHNLMYNCNFYLPCDVVEEITEDSTNEYLTQLQGEYWKKFNVTGTEVIRFKQEVNNHYRSAENYCQAACSPLLYDVFNPQSVRLQKFFAGQLSDKKDTDSLKEAMKSAFGQSSGPNWW